MRIQYIHPVVKLYFWGLLFFITACGGKSLKKEFKLNKCEEKEFIQTFSPSFSEFRNGWEYSNVRIDSGIMYIQTQFYTDTTKRILCLECVTTKSNYCETNDSSITSILSIYYGNKVTGCDSSCNSGLVHLISEHIITKTGKKVVSENILTNQHGKNPDELFLFKQEEVTTILNKAWSIIPRIRPIIDSMEYYFLRNELIFDKNHKYCGAYYDRKPLEVNIPPYNECFAKRFYSINYTLSMN